jgi:hypothetical protein
MLQYAVYAEMRSPHERQMRLFYHQAYVLMFLIAYHYYDSCASNTEKKVWLVEKKQT